VFAALGPLYNRSRLLGKVDIAAADRAPEWLVSGFFWVFELRRPA
jgi:hypothetical protein